MEVNTTNYHNLYKKYKQKYRLLSLGGATGPILPIDEFRGQGLLARINKERADRGEPDAITQFQVVDGKIINFLGAGGQILAKSDTRTRIPLFTYGGQDGDRWSHSSKHIPTNNPSHFD